MTMKILDLEFEVKQATLGAYLPDPNDPYGTAKTNPEQYGLLWGVHVDFEDSRVEGERCTPSIYTDGFRLPIRHWSEFAGRALELSAPYDANIDLVYGFFHVWDHNFIPSGRIQFLERNGTRFQIHWQGLCDICWNEKYGRNLPFTLDTVITFDHYYVYGRSDDTDRSMRERLAKYVNLSDMVQLPIEIWGTPNEAGIRSANSVFRPAV